jgi:hypothetical protein
MDALIYGPTPGALLHLREPDTLAPILRIDYDGTLTYAVEGTERASNIRFVQALLAVREVTMYGPEVSDG